MHSTMKLAAVPLILGALVNFTGCAGPTSAGSSDGQDLTGDIPAMSDGSAFHPRLLEIAREYTTYPLVDPNMKWAPGLCAAPPGPPAPTYSNSDDEAAHGGKLYFLFAADAGEYAVSKTKPSPIGQVIAKEAWQAEAVENPSSETYPKHSSGHQVSRYARRGEQVYQAGEQRELFIMFKTDPHAPHTDEGWVYGVVSPDGEQVITAGRLENCMACHQEAGVDRLFGPKHPPDLTEGPR